MTPHDLEAEFPRIAWRTPLRVVRADGAFGYACRFCIATEGLKAEEIPALPKTEREVEAHIREQHPAARLQ